MPTNTTAARSVGDMHVLTFAVRSTAGTLTNSEVRLVVEAPSSSGSYVISAGPSTANTTGGSTYPGFTHTATGTWEHRPILTMPGDWRFQFNSTGAVVVSTGTRLAVRTLMAST